MQTLNQSSTRSNKVRDKDEGLADSMEINGEWIEGANGLDEKRNEMKKRLKQVM